MRKKRLTPGGLIPTGDISKNDRPPNWAAIDQSLVRECGVASLQACLDLTIADVQILLGKFAATEGEPEWFVRSWRAGTATDKVEALRKLLRD